MVRGNKKPQHVKGHLSMDESLATPLAENNTGKQLKHSTYQWINFIATITFTLQIRFLMQERLTESEFLHTNLEMYWQNNT